MRSSTVFVLGLFLSILASGASGLAGLRQHLRVEVCPRHPLRLAGRGAVQAGIGNTRLLRQAIGIGRPEASTDAIGLDHLKVCLLVAPSPKLPRHARPG
jgi:hypothetical protein